MCVYEKEVVNIKKLDKEDNRLVYRSLINYTNYTVWLVLAAPGSNSSIL